MEVQNHKVSKEKIQHEARFFEMRACRINTPVSSPNLHELVKKRKRNHIFLLAISVSGERKEKEKSFCVELVSSTKSCSIVLTPDTPTLP